MVLSRSRCKNGDPVGVAPLENVHLSFYYYTILYEKLLVDRKYVGRLEGRSRVFLGKAGDPFTVL
jgi:hypothetical protein